MNRRKFLQLGASGLALASLRHSFSAELADAKKRVGLIGTGWYGKADLLEVNPLCRTNPCQSVPRAFLRRLIPRKNYGEEKQVPNQKHPVEGICGGSLKFSYLKKRNETSPGHCRFLP